MNKKETYVIRKYREIKDREGVVIGENATFMVDSSSEVVEYNDKNLADKTIDILNANTDNKCRYELVKIK